MQEELLREIRDIELARLLARPEETLGLVSAFSLDAVRETRVVLSLELAASGSTTLYSNVPLGYVGITTYATLWLSTQRGLDVTVLRDEQEFYTDSGAVNTDYYLHRFWLPAFTRWTFRLTNNSASAVLGVHGLFTGFWVKQDVWEVISRRLKVYGGLLAATGGLKGA